MPGEHEPQQAVLIGWPFRPDNWRDNGRPAQDAFVEVIEAILPATPVQVCAPESQRQIAENALPKEASLLCLPSDDCWLRDIGPTFVTNPSGELRGIDWQFNAWGGAVDGLYPSWEQDDVLASRLLSQQGVKRYRAPLVMEGGAFHVDGEGTCFTTAECLLHPGRNPALGQRAIESFLRDYLGVNRVFWIPKGVFADETNGHVDNLMHVVRPGVVVLTWCDDPSDPMYQICREALDTLQAQPDAAGRHIEVHKLPMPGPLFYTEAEVAGLLPAQGMARNAGERLAGSYANFLVTNSRVIYPLLDERVDDRAGEILSGLFPERAVAGVPGREILLGGGNIHCITQQIPKGSR